MSITGNKIYNYEVPPPAGVWEAIADELDNSQTKVIPIYKKNNKILYLSLAAASVAIIVFSVIFFSPFDKNADKINLTNIINDTTQNKNEAVLMTVPVDETKNIVKDKKELLIAKNNTGTNRNVLEKDPVEKTITQPEDDFSKSTYITVASPEGNSIKLSEKAATLLDTSEAKPVWNKKVKQWKEIMKGNTLAPTPGNFLDIMELTRSLKDKK